MVDWSINKYCLRVLTHELPLRLGEGWGEGGKIDKSLFDNRPHPNLLPEGEGIVVGLYKAKPLQAFFIHHHHLAGNAENAYTGLQLVVKTRFSFSLRSFAFLCVFAVRSFWV